MHINVNYTNSGFDGFVSHELLESCEAPRVQPSSLPLPGFDPGSDVGQVLQRYRCTLRNRIHDLFGQDMIAIPAETSYPARQPLQVPFGRTGAFRLQSTTKPESPIFDFPPVLFPEEAVAARNSRMNYTQIDTDNYSVRFGVGEGLFDRDVEPQTTFAVFAEIRRRYVPRQVAELVLIESQTHLLSSGYTGECGIAILEFDVRSARIVSDGAPFRGGTRYFSLLVLQRSCGRQGLGSSNSRRANELRRQSSLTPFGIVGIVMQLRSVDASFSPTDLADSIERLGVDSCCLLQRSLLIRARFESDPDCSDRIHTHTIPQIGAVVKSFFRKEAGNSSVG